MIKQHYSAIVEPLQVGELLCAIDGYVGQPTTVAALKLAPYLFVHPGELRMMEHSELNLDAAEWRIPAARMKMGEPHVVPLSAQAVAILRDVLLLGLNSRYVFPSLLSRDRPMSENTVNNALPSSRLFKSGDDGARLPQHGEYVVERARLASRSYRVATRSCGTQQGSCCLQSCTASRRTTQDDAGLV